MKSAVCIASSFIVCLNSFAQNIPTSIATWKNNAKGAYNIIHDDFGDYTVIGINNYADTMNYNRGLKFTFGAITLSCEGNPGMYTKANTMISHGHEIINHSHTHSCAVQNQNCGGTGTNYGWSEPATNKLNIEIDTSSKSIFKNTGIQPRFFIYPYDQFSTNSDNYLKSKGYIGSRTGTYNGAGSSIFQPDVAGFFKTAFVVDVQNVGAEWLSVNHNYWVDYAITNGMWVNREMHNIGNSGWGRISLANYRTHLDYVKSKVVSGDLWVGTISEILTYQIQKLNYSPTSSYNSNNKTITVSWNIPTFSVSGYLAPLTYKSPVTLNVDVSSVPGIYKIYQNSQLVTDWTKKGNIISVNIYPHNGPVTLTESTCNTVCILTNPVGKSVNESENFVLTGSATGIGNISYYWLRNNSSIPGVISNTLTITSATIANAGNYYLVASNGTAKDTSTAAIVIVNTQTPFSGTRIVIPGKIEAEDFDLGGQNLAFNETSSTNEGDGDGYRSGPVDVEICSNGGYNVGYITNGEWLEYSVNVTYSGIYTFEFRIAADNGTQPKGQLSVSLNGNLTVPTQVLPYTGGWQTWQTVSVSGISLAQGNHILRLNSVVGNFNIDYINTRLTQIITDQGEIQELLPVFQVFPNPSDHWLTIQSNTSGDVRYKINSISGTTLIQGINNSSSSSINIETLPSGIYFVEIISPLTNQTLRFIKN